MRLSIPLFIAAAAWSPTGFVAADAKTTTRQMCTVPSYGLRYNLEPFAVPFKSVVIFGDSLSDVGNIYNVSNGTEPGIWSWEGRYSDGEVWNEYVAEYFGLPDVTTRVDYAWGGATTDNTYIPSYSTYIGAPVPAVNEQIDRYLKEHSSSDPSDKLHCLYSGYNDYWWYVYRNYTTALGQNMNLAEVSAHVAADVVHQMRKLYEAGASYFLVANSLDMSKCAEAYLRTEKVRESYDILVSGHNAKLSELLDDFETKNADATVYRFDVYSAMNCINEQKSFLGFDELKVACHPGSENDTISDNCGKIFSYKFWDLYHPTTHSHYIQSMWAIESIYAVEHPEEGASSPSSRTVDTSTWMSLMGLLYLAITVISG